MFYNDGKKEQWECIKEISESTNNLIGTCRQKISKNGFILESGQRVCCIENFLNGEVIEIDTDNFDVDFDEVLVAFDNDWSKKGCYSVRCDKLLVIVDDCSKKILPKDAEIFVNKQMIDNELKKNFINLGEEFSCIMKFEVLGDTEDGRGLTGELNIYLICEKNNKTDNELVLFNNNLILSDDEYVFKLNTLKFFSIIYGVTIQEIVMKDKNTYILIKKDRE